MSISKSTQTKKLLIDALIELLAERSIDGVSVRDVAAKAGVNHGLVHRHFGSKEALIREAAARVGAELHEGTRAGLSTRSFDHLRKNRALARVAARLCLDGPDDVFKHFAPTPDKLEEIVAPIRASLERSGLAKKLDPYVLNALLASAIIGWFVFKPILRGYGVGRQGDDHVAELMALLDQLTA